MKAMKSGVDMTSRVFRSSASALPLLCFAIAVFALLRALMQTMWFGEPWFDHVDHWQSLFHAKDWTTVNQSGFPRMIFARIPSWFPDLLLARVLFVFGSGVSPFSIVLAVVLQFLAYIIFASLCLSRCVSVSFARSWSAISLVLAAALYFTSYLGLAFVPMHHGGNVISVLLTILALLFWVKEEVWWAGVALIVLSFLGSASNRFFVFSGLIPVVVVLILRFRLSSVPLVLLCAEAGRRGWFFVSDLMQGRDEMPVFDVRLVSGAFRVRFFSPILMVAVAVLLFSLGLLMYSRSGGLGGAFPSFARYEFRVLWLFSCAALLASLPAEAMATGVESGSFTMRYLFAPLFLVQVVFGACLAPFFSLVAAHYAYLRRSVIAILGGIVIISFVGLYSQDGSFGAMVAASRSGSVIDVLARESLPSRYGLAAYPYWQAGVLEGLSGGRFDVMESSSDGTPMFWHRWKGSLFEGKKLKPFSFVLVSPEYQDRVVGHYGEPGRKVFCEREGFECLWIYADNRKILSDIQVFIDTYGDEIKY